MWVPRCLVAAIRLLVLIATPAVVEGTCHCGDVCPAYDTFYRWEYGSAACWFRGKHCNNKVIATDCSCPGYCMCNTFDCHCDACELVAGGCGWTEQTYTGKEKDDGCADFRTVTSLSAEGKRDFLAAKYCVEEDQVVVDDIYELILSEVLLKLHGSVLTCALFNKSYVDVSSLKLCKDKHHDGEL